MIMKRQDWTWTNLAFSVSYIYQRDISAQLLGREGSFPSYSHPPTGPPVDGPDGRGWPQCGRFGRWQQIALPPLPQSLGFRPPTASAWPRLLRSAAQCCSSHLGWLADHCLRGALLLPFRRLDSHCWQTPRQSTAYPFGPGRSSPRYSSRPERLARRAYVPLRPRPQSRVPLSRPWLPRWLHSGPTGWSARQLH